MDLGPDDTITASSVPEPKPRYGQAEMMRAFLLHFVVSFLSLAVLLVMVWRGTVEGARASEANGAQLVALRAEVRRATEDRTRLDAYVARAQEERRQILNALEAMRRDLAGKR